jgi:hypothetical protein
MVAIRPLGTSGVNGVARDKLFMHRRLRAAVRLLLDSLPERIR